MYKLSGKGGNLAFFFNVQTLPRVLCRDNLINRMFSDARSLEFTCVRSKDMW